MQFERKSFPGVARAVAVVLSGLILGACGGGSGEAQLDLSDADRSLACASVRELLLWEEENPRQNAKEAWMTGSSAPHELAIAHSNQLESILAEIKFLVPSTSRSGFAALESSISDMRDDLERHLAENPPVNNPLGLQATESIMTVGPEGDAAAALRDLGQLCDVDLAHWGQYWMTNFSWETCSQCPVAEEGG